MRTSVLGIVAALAAACGGSSFSASSNDAGADATTEAAPTGDSAGTVDASDAFVQGDGGVDAFTLDAPEKTPTSEASAVDAPEEGQPLCCKVTGACSEDPPCGTQSSSLTVCCSALACGNALLPPGACTICVPGGTCCPTGVVGACP
jgi:hypothetical protein